MLALRESLLVAVAAAHVLLAPYTKVEESFALHALRDLLNQPVLADVRASVPVLRWPAQYDHVSFPGAVPRSFVGPLVLATVAWPFVQLGKLLELWTTELQVQVLFRLLLAALSVASILFLTRRVRATFGRVVQDYTLLITASQFHLMFWCGRTIPNMFAFPLVQVVMAMYIGPWAATTKRGSNVEILEGFATLTMAAIIMRLELLAFLAPLALDSLDNGTTKLVELVAVGAVAALASLGLTVGVDSYFWGRWVWPEGEAILFNVLQGHASDWGTSPWHYYFTSSLPRLLNFGVPLALLAMLVDRRVRSLVLSCMGFVVLLSCLGHKEWRFLVYIIPTMNVCAAAGLQNLSVLFTRRIKTTALFLILATNLILGALSLYASMHNYPGGVALRQLTRCLPPGPALSIHIDSNAAMTGASRFLHAHELPQAWYLTAPASSGVLGIGAWSYNRSETLLPDEYDAFDYLVTGQPASREGFVVLGVVRGFSRYRLEWPTSERVWPLRIAMQESVWIMRRK